MDENRKETDREALEAMGPPPPVVKSNPTALWWWGVIVPALAENRRIRRIDAFTVSALVLEIAKYTAATKHIKRYGQCVRDRGAKGAPPTFKRNPSSMIASNALAHVRELWKDLMMTPLQRDKDGRGQGPSPEERMVEDMFFPGEQGARR